MLIVVVAIILILIYYVKHDVSIDKNRNINLMKISNLSLKIQIIENLIAEKEKDILRRKYVKQKIRAD